MTIEIKVSEDLLSAGLTVSAAEHNYPGRDAIEQALNLNGIKFGIDNEQLNKVLENKFSVTDCVIAKGRLPSITQDPELEWLIDIETGFKPSITDDGIANFKNIKTFEPVVEGQQLIRVKSPGQGEAGMSVLGEEIPSDKFALSQIMGNNTLISRDGDAILAGIDGYVFYSGNCISVDRVYHIKGGVNYATGNVNFDGMIIIDGDVRSGFRVEATENIFISGNVEGAEIYSYTGDIAVKHGILGKGRAKVVAGGSLICGFIQDATVGVNKDVIIDHYAINSKITSGAAVLLEENEGLIRGGKIRAEQKIIAVEIGSEQNIQTEIHIGGERSPEMHPKIEAIRRDINQIRAQYSQKTKLVAFYQILEKDSRHLSNEKSNKVALIKAEIAELRGRLSDLEHQETELLQTFDTAPPADALIVKGTLHSGVNIAIGKSNYFVDQSMNNIKFCLKDEKIISEHFEKEKGNGYA